MKKGFALLLTVLIISVVLASALTAYNLIRGEIMLSSGASASQVAFYAARSGNECVRFWEFKHPGYTVSAFDITPPARSITCSGLPFTVGGSSDQNKFSIQFGTNSCTNVTVTKDTPPSIKITVESQGQNTVPCTTQDSRTAQRGLYEYY